MLSNKASSVDSTTAALAIEGLRIDHRTLGNFVDDVTLEIFPGEVLALVGESGCGKSLTALSLMRLLPAGFEVDQGSIYLGETDMLAQSEAELNALRGRQIAMLFQQPQVMLDPTATVASQVAEPLRLHLGMNRKDVLVKVIDLLSDVGIPEPEYRAKSYAFQLSGGMAQRVMIAAALAGSPQVLIADEPTTALDVTVQVQILNLLQRERLERDLAILLITHDLSVVSALADRVAVMYSGRIVEQGSRDQVLHRPRHPYTQTLVECSLMQEQPDGRLFSAHLSSNTGGASSCCRFFARCTVERTSELYACCGEREPPLESLEDGAGVRCWAINPPSEAGS